MKLDAKPSVIFPGNLVSLALELSVSFTMDTLAYFAFAYFAVSFAFPFAISLAICAIVHFATAHFATAHFAIAHFAIAQFAIIFADSFDV